MPSHFHLVVLMLVVVMYSSQLSMAANSTIDCNHAFVEDGEDVLIADVCYPDGDDSQMLTCHEGQGHMRKWALSTDCEGHRVFQATPSDFGYDVVCDADPCRIAVLEGYNELSTSSDSSDSDSADTTWRRRRLSTDADIPNHLKDGFLEALIREYVNEPWAPVVDQWYATEPEGLTEDIILIFAPIQDHVRDAGNASELAIESIAVAWNRDYDSIALSASWPIEDSAYWSPEGESSLSESGDSSESDSAVNGASDSSSSDSSHSTCDTDSAPEVTTLIVNTCLAVGGGASVKITCTGIYDAAVEYFVDDWDHECSGAPTMTMSVNEFFGDCEHFVACNVKAGDETDQHGAAQTVAVFLSLLITLAGVLNA